ncbi:hypothetical protein HELRODRAFT_85047, partial [Helobdella robusta]|uniref:galactosylceramidase n=1 Tax=Helobdella robusta TaxID=6412 RepID=T1G5S1_HELRO
ATSKLLVNYPEQQRNEILDYLFKPYYGASLQILKVEIGGDSQSTDGSESSHMHAEDDEDYNRGYQWGIMKEAKKRNPSIKLYGLPWVFPGWLADDRKLNPYFNISSTVRYVVNWIKGAKVHHDLDINYIGLLRRTLNDNGLNDVKLVAPDAMNWSYVDELISDEELRSAVDIIGQHYPGGYSPDIARSLSKKLWASEDYSTVDDVIGSACWARVLSEGVVFGYLTSFIAWNMVSSYYEGLPYSRSSLMTANQPWSGHYEVNGPIFITAHHTHFYDVGWVYSPHGEGVGVLKGGGTFVTLTNPVSRDVTIVVETIVSFQNAFTIIRCFIKDCYCYNL